LNNELTGDLSGRRVSFKGAEVALPDASLVIAPIRFKHFYWIWRTFTFESAIKEWNPKQPADSSFYALKPQSAHDPEILKRISSDFMAFTLKTYEDWAKQLATYLSSRLKPFQDAGHIIQ